MGLKTRRVRDFTAEMVVHIEDLVIGAKQCIQIFPVAVQGNVEHRDDCILYISQLLKQPDVALYPGDQDGIGPRVSQP
jgi:hypothetical protein